jgi:SPP1 gp7 family putative phage head morphogenesis protein
MLRTQLEEGIRLGESVDKIADRVTEAFDTQRFRAYRIARTEVAESFNSGRYGTMKDAGVEKLEWLSARDDRVRDSHQEVDGEVIMLGDHFSNGLLYPLDPSGPPEEIVNCRCVSVPVA